VKKEVRKTWKTTIKKTGGVTAAPHPKPPDRPLGVLRVEGKRVKMRPFLSPEQGGRKQILPNLRGWSEIDYGRFVGKDLVTERPSNLLARGSLLRNQTEAGNTKSRGTALPYKGDTLGEDGCSGNFPLAGPYVT